MSKGQRPRRIGMGMKERDPLANMREPEVESSEDVSMAEGQSEAAEEPESTVEEGVEKGQVVELQNLESETVARVRAFSPAECADMVATDLNFVSADPEGDRKRAEATYAAIEEARANMTDEERAAADAKADSILSAALQQSQEGSGDPKAKNVADALAGFGFEIPEGAMITGVSVHLTEGDANSSPLLGEQPDGSYKWPVTVQELYVTAVQDWAKEEGVTAEEWLSRRVAEILEPYAMPAKGR